MRSHTTLRSAFRFGMMMAVATGVSFAATQQAHADTSVGDNESVGTAALKFDYLTGLDTSIDTGFLGPSTVQVRAVVKIDPVTAGGPLYSINMAKGAVIGASWANDKKIVLKAANGLQTDGSVTVHHTLTPTLELKVSLFGLTADFPFSADALVNKLPGAKFAYDSKAVQAFAPWAFTAIDTKLNAPDLADSTLLSEGLDILGLDPTQWEGTLGVRATTKPTFSYKTTKVMLVGSPAPITALGGQSVIDAIDGDFLEMTAQVEGEMDVSGTMDIQPFVTLSKAFGKSFGITADITAYSHAYTVPPSKVTYQATLVHIPLPNVHVPTAGVDLGSVKSGGSATKTVTITNTGEKAAVMTFKSSDAQFAVPGGTITVAPKGSYDVEVKFAPATGGAAKSDITVTSNDPDSPEQTFEIGANGAGVNTTNTNNENPGSAASADSGCGCKTAGTTTSTGGWASIGLLGLGALVFVRRRRNAA